MRFSDVVKKYQNLEENKNKIIIVKCGVFMNAIGRDALYLSKIFNLKVTCLRPGTCKVGIAVNSLTNYMDVLEEKGYGYSIYDYDKNTKELILKYTFDGTKKMELENYIDCMKCNYYKEQKYFEIIDLFGVLKEREKRNEK